MRQAYSIRECITLAAFALLAPFVHFYVLLYWSMLSVPALPIAESDVVEVLWLFAGDFVGAALAALILAAPLAWLVRGSPMALASVLALTAAVAALHMWQGSFTDLAAFLALAELFAFFLLCWAVAHVVARRSRNPAHAT